MADTIDWPPRRPPQRKARLILFAVLAAIFFGGGTALSYYVDALWFDSLGYSEVFWRTLTLQGRVFAIFTGVTFVLLYALLLSLKPDRIAELGTGSILINGQPLQLPVGPVLRAMGTAAALLVSFATGAGMMNEWPTFALYWQAPAASGVVDPIFGRPLTFYLFTLPAWELVSGWLMTLSVIACAASVGVIALSGGTRLLTRGKGGNDGAAPFRSFSLAFSVLLLVLAARVYFGRFDRLYEDHSLFAGVTYTDAHVVIPGTLIVSGALVLGAVGALLNAIVAGKLRWLLTAVMPAMLVYAGVGVASWYTTSFVVKPNELVRERPFIEHNIEMTRQAYALNRIREEAFPADTGVDAVDVAGNQATLQNIRLWDWRALQDTLRQIQEIRTYYDFPDIDIDRYTIDGTVRQMMLATRELNVEKLPTSSRTWINEKLIYTHGYGVTMNSVNGFTPEGLPKLVLSNMPVQSTVPGFELKRPEVYFGELTTTDVYVKTRQKEFNYPQGENNNLTVYEGNGGIPLGGFARRMLIALDRGDLAKLPFSDDITSESRLLMRREIRERTRLLAPFLTLDPDAYIVVGDDGKLYWMMDAYTTSDSFPYARHYRLGRESVNYLRNSVKVVIDAYDGATSFYVFDTEDPILAAYRSVFPSLFKDASAMPTFLRAHVRYPELMLKLQAAVYGIYHMTNPEVFYNREDLWTVASQVGMNERQEQATQSVEPNFVLMRLPGEKGVEYVEMLPFTPSNRNNLVGWIAGRSDGEHYGTAIVYNFPKTKLVDGPLQIEARIDQNAQLSGQLSLWNQQGSRVRRGNMLVIPIGRALLYAEPIYLQAERSPMPELRLVVLALQDRLAYGTTFEAAMQGLFGEGQGATAASANAPANKGGTASPSPAAGPVGDDRNALIAQAARDLADYQRLTAEGKLGEAGQKLESLKHALETLVKK